MDEKLIPVKITKIINECPNVKTFRLKSVNGESFDFKAGQFVNLHVNIQNNGYNEDVIRSYSIASSPLNKDYIELTIEKIPNGKLTQYFCENAKINDVYYVSEPKGKFTYSEDNKKIVLIAGGTGVVPMMSIMRFCTDKNLDTEITLIYSAKTEDDLIYRKELNELNKKNSKLQVIITLTRCEWEGKNGRINKKLIINNIVDIKENIFFLCGSLQFVRDMVSILKELGVDRKQIKRDVWV